MTTRSTSHHAGRALAAAAARAFVAWGASALPAGADPAGNNGTVKVTPHGGSDDSQNDAHVKCSFDLNWYGFDEGANIVSTVDFTMQAPTGDATVTATDPSQVFVGGDPAGGGNDFDGQATYTLAFAGTPDPQQGYHVKITTHTPGSQGADTKHKVLWVQPCDEGPPTS